MTATKIFVLDTSVILHDSNAINCFEEHDIALPITVLEELDSFKKGNRVLNLQAREFTRKLDHLSEQGDLRAWVPLNGSEKGRLRVVTPDGSEGGIVKTFGTPKNDHRILEAALTLTRQEPSRKVILVSKDINLRVKARSLGLTAEDYETVQVKDVDHLYTGKSELDLAADEPIDLLYEDGSLPVAALPVEPPPPNHYFILRGPSKSALAYFDPNEGRLERVVKGSAYGIEPRNAEQTFALHAILRRGVNLVSITGAAGTGKTLLALAGALEQRTKFHQIYLARPIVPLSNKDIGYLPGDIEDKISPFMQPLWDNLALIKSQFGERSKEHKRIGEMLQLEKIQVVPLAYIRGRSLSKVIFIVDEAQNLTPHEIKTIITRAGEGTKIILTGDIFQIDTPYLDARSNGLSYLIDRLESEPIYAHVNLEKGERSELADLAGRLL